MREHSDYVEHQTYIVQPISIDSILNQGFYHLDILQFEYFVAEILNFVFVYFNIIWRQYTSNMMRVFISVNK